MTDAGEYYADAFVDECDEWRERATAAEAQVEQLRAALKQVLYHCQSRTPQTSIERIESIARAALALPEGERE